MDWGQFLKDNFPILVIILGALGAWKAGLLSAVGSRSALMEKNFADCEKDKKDLDEKLKKAEEDARQLFKDALQKAQLADIDNRRLRDLEDELRRLR